MGIAGELQLPSSSILSLKYTEKKWTDSKTMKICNSYAPDSRLHHTPCADGEFEPRLAGAGVAN